MNSRVVVIGGGFAGLRSAVSLADAGVKVTLVENKVGLGGRARSFTDPASGEVVDNGQHLFLSGYHRTLAFLERLGTRDRIFFQDRFRVEFVEPESPIRCLEFPPLPSPWHFFLGLLGFSGLLLRDKTGLLLLKAELRRGNDAEKAETVRAWMDRLGQSEWSQKHFWDPLTVAALNGEPSAVSCIGLKQVLRTLLLEPAASSRLGMATVGLSELYGVPAQQSIEEAGGQVFLNRAAIRLQIDGQRCGGVLLSDGTSLEADGVICAVPPAALLRLLPEPAGGLEDLKENLKRFRASAILSVNLWVDRSPTEALFTAMIGTRFQWLFNKKSILAKAGISAGYVSLILSAADSFLERSNDELVKMALEDLEACFPKQGRLKPVRTQVVREREATVALTPGMEKFRPACRAPIGNLFLAGDWTATGLPATIESAVLSGEEAASLFLRQ